MAASEILDERIAFRGEPKVGCRMNEFVLEKT